jgi:hypothetical protein
MRAPCRVCRRPCALTRRGRVWFHRARAAAGPYDGLPCRGYGHPPLGQPGPDLEPAPRQTFAPSPLVAEHGFPGTVYLLHLDEPFAHARHYLGWASPGNLNARLAHHAAGSGANLLRHVAKAGIGWQLARTWSGDRHLERRLKRYHGSGQFCPACRPGLEARLLARVFLPDE